MTLMPQRWTTFFAAVVLVVTTAGVGTAQQVSIENIRANAELGYANQQFMLGVAYEFGMLVPQDDAEAVRWYRLAAEQGSSSALFNLGAVYAAGQGVPQDDIRAYMWFNVAASRLTGTQRETATEWRDKTANLLTPDQRAEAQRLAREWDEAHPRD